MKQNVIYLAQNSIVSVQSENSTLFEMLYLCLLPNKSLSFTSTFVFPWDLKLVLFGSQLGLMQFSPYQMKPNVLSPVLAMKSNF